MRFTPAQYDAAIKALQQAKTQLEPNGSACCVICAGDHFAWECGHNPLRAMAAARAVYDKSGELHEALHGLCGFYGSPLFTTPLMAFVPNREREE